MMIDANAYMGSWPYWRMDVRTAEQLEGSLRSNGIDKSLVSSLRSVFYGAEEGNQELLAACNEYPESIYGLATLSPFFRKEDTGYQTLKSGIFRGIRIYPRYHGFSLPAASGIFEVAEELKVPVVIPQRLIMSWSLPSLSADEIISVVKQYPTVTFVLSAFNYDLLGNILLHHFPRNLYVETSGFQIVEGVETLVDVLGADHVMLGTAMPVQYPQSGIQKVLKSEVPQEKKEMVVWENAARLFRV